jgi:hypothetical protein
VDRLVVTERPWARDDQAEPVPPEEPAAPEPTADVIESEQEGLDYEPPAGPTEEKT